MRILLAYLKNSLKQLGLFVIIITLVGSVTSCKKLLDSPGESLQPEDDLMEALQTDTTTLDAYTVKVDSVASDFYSNVMIGNYVDDDFGVVEATGILQFIPSTSKPRYNENIRIDSVVLALAYQNATYGKNVPMYFNVKEVTDNLDYNSKRYSNSTVHTFPENLVQPGMEILDPNPELASVSGLGYTPVLKLFLKHSLAEKLLSADTTVLDNSTLFKEFFGGLAIGSETIDGQIINYMQNDAATRLTVYYTELGENEAPNTADFIVSKSTCKAFTVVHHQYQNTNLHALSSGDAVDGSQYCYLQSGQGTRVAVNIGGVNWLKDYKGVTINRAELVIPYDKHSKLTPIQSVLIFYRKPGSEFYTYTETGGNVNVSTGLYRVNLTNHVQEYLEGNINSDEIFIQPVYTLSQFSNSWSVARSLLHGPRFNEVEPEQNMRLIITYSY